MLFKSKKSILTLINNKSYQSVQVTSSDILKGLKVLTEQCASNGTLKSGTFLQRSLNLITDKITISCRDILLEVEKVAEDLNVTYSRKQIEAIAKIINEKYTSLINSALSTFHHNMKNTFEDMSLDGTSEIAINCLRGNIANMIKEKMTEIDLKNIIGKDKPEVKQSKISNAIAFIAAIISIISLIIAIASYYKK